MGKNLYEGACWILPYNSAKKLIDEGEIEKKVRGYVDPNETLIQLNNFKLRLFSDVETKLLLNDLDKETKSLYILELSFNQNSTVEDRLDN